MTRDEVPLLLVDGHNLLWRGAFGFPAAVRSRDKTRDLTAEFAFFALLRVAVRDEMPAAPEIVVVFDGQHGATERQRADPGYKANRVIDEAALRPLRAIPHVQAGLTLYDIAWIEIDTAEADDVIATFVTATKTQEPERRVWILSGDRDYYQLVSEQVAVLNTAMRPGRRHIGPAEVVERYGVTPAQWPCFCSLKGDPADNIPGIKGIGATTAARLLAGGRQLEDIADGPGLRGYRQQALRDTWPQVLAWRDLIRMRADLPLAHRTTETPTPALPKPADVIDKLGLW